MCHKNSDSPVENPAPEDMLVEGLAPLDQITEDDFNAARANYASSLAEVPVGVSFFRLV